MADPVVAKWKQSGEIFLWTYLENKKNYPGWHFSADRVGASSLLQLFDKMVIAKWSSFKDISISRPTHKILKIPNNKNGKAKWRSPKTFRIKYAKHLVSNTHWSLEIKEQSVNLVVGLHKLNEFREGIENVMRSQGDYAIGPDDGLCHNDLCLWFW
jgi:hypothetical protein